MTTTELKKTSNKAHAQTDRATQLMQLLSVIYEPISQTKFYLCAKAFGITQNNGKQLTPQSFGTIIKQLINKKVIVEQKKSYTCLPDQVEMLSKQALKAGYFEKMANIVQKKIPVSQRWRGPKASNWNQAVRELRIALYLQREKAAMKALEECEINFREYYEENPLIRICFKPFDPASFLKLPPAISHAAIAAAYQTTIDPLLDLDKLTDWLLDALHRQTYQLPSDKIYQASTLFLLKGDISRAKALLRYSGDYHRQMLSGWVSFLEGSNDLALEQFENALNTLKKTTKKRKLFIESLSGIFYLLALLRRNSPGDISRINDYIKIATKSQEYERHHEIYGALHFLADFMTNPKAVPYFEIRLKKWPASRSALEYFISVLVLFWARSHLTIKHVKSLTACVKDLENTDYQWLLGETSELLASISKKSTSAHAKRAKAIRKSCGFETIVNIVQVKTAWERTLDAMLKLDVEKNDKPVKKKSRLIWLLSLDDGWLTDVTIKEQKQKTNGGWSAGRKVALKRLLEEKETLDCLSDQDIRASRTIISDRDYWGISYRINPRQLLPALVGHPLLFLNDANNTPLELVKGSPEIVVTKKGQELRIKMRPSFAEGETTAFVKETETQWKIIETTAEQRQLASLIGSELIIPLEAKDKVLSSMSAIAPFVDIHSDIGGGVTEAETVDADSTLHVLLSPLDEGLKIEARTQVFGSKGPYYHPGEGGKTIIAEVDGKRLQTTRNLKQEQKNLQQIIDQCHELGNIEMYHNEWAIYDPETCLEILLELKQQENVIVSWPEGEKLKVQQTIGLSNLKMVIKKENDWFSAGGEIKLDDGQVLNMKRLIELTRQAKGRFISLADGQFLALTNTFKNRMEELQAFGEEKDEEILLHPLAALALDEMTNDVGSLKSDKNWKSYISRFHEAMKLEPEIPSTLQAELRDYQKEGYQWLVRLAHWGVGACLADDMGLGKTVQAIALLLHRATQGPALVVAPTSVAMNWMDEIERFAPTLNIIDYRESKRNEVLKSIAAFDVVICSYGLIQNGIEQIESVKWSTVILDEAQAIKNSATKRSQTIMRLKADVKIIMTGTPIENHLGELWNLFRFINPGLLGSMENFNSRYANPIVKEDSIDTRQKLKKLIHPYILRRTKTQVLKELPARTEIVLQVDMSKDEAALYEALRRDAIEKFAQSDLPQGHRQLEILAEITRLRRACCNPALVLKAGAPESSKLALFANIVQELLDNNHKALVFSQFVDHLAIIQEKLKSMGINYQYLDGSTPAKERKKRVTAFQAGNGDIFLISLKAGGVGLNLTAADYVIHMDPWWNPAVEDQASDRAHRIGQKRPVTVYRMITKNTIEEKIVALHQGKRDLADNLLAGSEVAGKVNIEELLSLLQEK